MARTAFGKKIVKATESVEKIAGDFKTAAGEIRELLHEARNLLDAHKEDKKDK
jgi:hypothetical protein